MNVLIFGATGQVGHALVASAPPGTEVVACSRSECDIGSLNQIEAAIERAQPEIIFNAAAYTAVDRAETDADAAERINATAAGAIAERARAAGARLVHLSTDFIFDGRQSRPYRPDDPAAPVGVYARTKHQGELAVLAADPGALIVRTAWVYAARGANFVNTMLRLMAERDRIQVVADQVGTPTSAASLAAALWSLAELGASGIHHFTDAGVASWYDFAVAVNEEATQLGMLDGTTKVVPIRSVDYPTPAARPPYSVLDKSSTWALLGTSAPHWRVSLRAVLKELAEIA